MLYQFLLNRKMNYPYICISLFWTSFSFRSPQCIKQSSLYCRACSHFLGGFPGDLDGKETACNAEDPGSVPGLGRSPGEGNGYLHLYSCLQNFMDRGASQAAIHGMGKSQTGLSNFHFHNRLSVAEGDIIIIPFIS